MNKKNNQRYQETHTAIQQVLLDLLDYKEIDKVTVREICEIAQINRSTFYAHYEDIFHLLDEIESEIEKGIFDAYMGTNISIETFMSVKYFEIVVKYIADNANFYRAYFSGHIKRPRLDQGFQLLCTHVLIPYFENIIQRPHSEMMYYFTFTFSGFVAVIKTWLETGQKESPRTIAQILWESIPENAQKS